MLLKIWCMVWLVTVCCNQVATQELGIKSESQCSHELDPAVAVMIRRTIDEAQEFMSSVDELCKEIPHLLDQVKTLELSQYELKNVALGKRVIISSVYQDDHKKWGAHFAVDGKISNTFIYFLQRNTVYFAHTDLENSPWLKIDLERDYVIQRVIIINRKDCCGSRLHDVVVKTGLTEKSFGTLCGKFKGPGTKGQRVKIDCPFYTRGRFVLVMIEGKPSDTENMLNLNEVEVFAYV